MSYRGSSRDDSITSATSASIGETDSQVDSIPVIISRHATNDWHDEELERDFGALGISEESGRMKTYSPGKLRLPTLTSQTSAPAALETNPTDRLPKLPSPEAVEAKRRSQELGLHESAESGDDEDEELGNVQVRARSPKSKGQRSSKLSTEMLRTNSQGSVVSSEDLMGQGQAAQALWPVVSETDALTAPAKDITGSLTPPEIFAQRPGHKVEDIDMDATPKALHVEDRDPDPTPRASHSPTHRD